MVTGNLAVEDSDVRLTRGRNKVRAGSAVSGPLSMLPQGNPCNAGVKSGRQCPGWGETEDLMESMAFWLLICCVSLGQPAEDLLSSHFLPL